MEVTTRDTTDRLLYEVSWSGRVVSVTTYYDTPTSPVKATLIFPTWQEAEACAKWLADAKMPKNVKRSADTSPEPGGK